MVFRLAHHHPDWLVQITVARDTFVVPRPAVIVVDVVVWAVSTMPHVKPLICATMTFWDPTPWIELQSRYGGKTHAGISFLICWTVLIKPIHVFSHIHRLSHQELVEFLLVFVWCARFSVVNDSDGINVSKAEHNLFPVPHAWMYVTRGICVLSCSGHWWENSFDEEEAWGDLGGN